jgi:hypothetical protein
MSLTKRFYEYLMEQERYEMFSTMSEEDKLIEVRRYEESCTEPKKNI